MELLGKEEGEEEFKGVGERLGEVTRHVYIDIIIYEEEEA